MKKNEQRNIRHRLLSSHTVVDDGLFAGDNTALLVSAASSPCLAGYCNPCPHWAVGRNVSGRSSPIMGVIKTTSLDPQGEKGGINTGLALPHVPHESRPRDHTIVPDTPPPPQEIFLGLIGCCPRRWPVREALVKQSLTSVSGRVCSKKLA